MIHAFILDHGGAGSDTPPETDFIMTVETTAPSESFTIPCQNVGTFNATVDWGDGTTSAITTYNDADLAHTYASAGTHTIRISGSFPNIYFNNGGDKAKVRTVQNLGRVGWTRLNNAFRGCSGLTSFRAGNTDTSAVTTMASMFLSCSSMTVANFAGMNTSLVTDMSVLLAICTALEELDISSFDTSKATTMLQMFYRCEALTSLDLSHFDTSKVLTMSGMFQGCTDLVDLDLSSFNTALVTNMSNMFRECTSFSSPDLSSFNTSGVTNMDFMFLNCGVFASLDLSGFNIEATTSMTSIATGSTIPTSDYDALLVSWAAQNAVNSLSVNFGSSKYSGVGAAARADLIATDLWTITDGGAV